MKSFFLLFQPQAMFHFLLKPTCRFHLNLPFISHFEPRLTVTQREMKEKTKKQTKKTKLHKIKNPMKQVEEKSPRKPCSCLTQQLNVTLLRVSPLTPNLHEAQWCHTAKEGRGLATVKRKRLVTYICVTLY